MEQIRQILKQLALNMELNIAMCDKIDELDKRILALEASSKAQKTRLDVLDRMVSETNYVAASKAYDARKAAMRSKNADTTYSSENK